MPDSRNLRRGGWISILLFLFTAILSSPDAAAASSKAKIVVDRDSVTFFGSKANGKKLRFSDEEVQRPNDDYSNALQLRKDEKRKVKVAIRKQAVLNQNATHVCVLENEQPVALMELDGSSSALSETPETGGIGCYDQDGNLRWHKQLASGRGIGVASSASRPVISSDGSRVVAISMELFASSATLHAFDAEGRESFRFPALEQMSDFMAVSSPKLSPSGRYLAFEVQHYPSRTIETMGVDLDSGRAGAFGDRYVVYEVSDEGIASVRNLWKKADSTTRVDIKSLLK